MFICIFVTLDKQTQIEIDSLVARLKQKDRNAVSELYDRYSDALYGLACKIVRSEEVAQDVLQDSFVKIWNKIDHYSAEKGSFFTWMLNITRNTAIDSIRKSNKMTKSSIRDIENDVDLISHQGLNISSIGLKELVEDLQSDHRVLVEYIYFKGYTQQEVSDELDIPLGTVKTRVRAAVRELQKIFTSILFIVLWIK